MADVDLFAPLSSLQWVDRDQLKPNDYNPNKVSEENLKLLVQSILTNGWTLPIVVRPDYCSGRCRRERPYLRECRQRFPDRTGC